VIVDEMPKTDTGKVRKRDLKQLVANDGRLL
jgi:acyl-coenzyme A synthetase/AMP-(fatty) acid ligase